MQRCNAEKQREKSTTRRRSGNPQRNDTKKYAAVEHVCPTTPYHATLDSKGREKNEIHDQNNMLVGKKQQLQFATNLIFFSLFLFLCQINGDNFYAARAFFMKLQSNKKKSATT